MPCSEPRFDELQKHQDAAVPLLCEMIQMLRAEYGHLDSCSHELREWARVHDVIDKLPGGWRSYEAGDLLERIAKLLKGVTQ